MKQYVQFYLLIALLALLSLVGCKKSIPIQEFYTLSEQTASFDWDALSYDGVPKLALQVNGKIYLFEDGVNTVEFRTSRDGDISSEPFGPNFDNSYAASFIYLPEGSSGEQELFTISSPLMTYIGSIPRTKYFFETFEADSYTVRDENAVFVDTDDDDTRARKDSLQRISFGLLWNQDVSVGDEWKSELGNNNTFPQSYFEITKMEILTKTEFIANVRCEFSATLARIDNPQETIRIERGVFVGYFENPFERLE